MHGELAKLGISISQAAVSKYMVRHRTPPSHTWRSFLDNHANDLVSLDFFTLPTATFRVLFVFIVLRHERRRCPRRPAAQSKRAGKRDRCLSIKMCNGVFCLTW